MVYKPTPNSNKGSQRGRLILGENSFSPRRGTSNLSQTSDPESFLCSLNTSVFIFLLTIISLMGALTTSYIMPIIQVRSFLSDTTPRVLDAIREGTLKAYDLVAIQKCWPMYSYPDGADAILELVFEVAHRLENFTTAERILSSESRRLSTCWRDCFTYCPVVVGLLLFSSIAQGYLSLHPFWKNVSPISPRFGLSIFHIAIMILQLAALFGTVKMHRSIDALFKKVAIIHMGDIKKTVDQKPVMTKSIRLCCMLLVFLRTSWTNKYPICKHGGVRMDINGRTLCHCPHNRINTGPLCEMVRVNFENLQTPLVLVSDLSLSLPLHMSVEFISRDFHGTGVLFTLGDYKKGMILELALKYGQPVIGLNDRRHQSTVVSLHDNTWHHLDIFLTKTPTSIEVVLIVDRCVMRRRCSQKLIFDGIISGVPVSGPLTLGMKSTEKHRLNELCLDSIVINSQLVDLSEATRRRPLARGCPKCEEACFFGAAGRCGRGGVCQNPIVAATDQYVCTCRPGFQPALNLFNTNVINSSAPCVEPASEWEIKRAFPINVRSKSGFMVLFSIRTRQMVTTIMRSRDGGLRLRIVDGHLEFHLYTESLMLPKIDVSDGKWHTIRLTLTPFLEESTSRMAELSVDGLWDSFYNSTLLQTDLIGESNLDESLTIEAISSCLSDLRRETRDIRNKIFQDYLIVESTKERQGFLQSGCKTYDPCTTFSPCGQNEVCSPEWRGYKCTCKTGFSRRIIQQSSAAHCVLTTCDPNPCKNGGECFVLANETATWGNNTVGVFCDCHGGWNGLFCEKPPLARPSLQNWWLIPFFFVLILILFWTTFYVCWWKRHRVKNTVSSVPVGPHFVEAQEKMSTESAVIAGEEDYRGSLDLSDLKVSERRTSMETRTTDLILSVEGERFLTMDQPLQYAFEGYDSSPSPTYFLNSNTRGHYNFFTHAP